MGKIWKSDIWAKAWKVMEHTFRWIVEDEHSGIGQETCFVYLEEQWGHCSWNRASDRELELTNFGGQKREEGYKIDKSR